MWIMRHPWRHLNLGSKPIFLNISMIAANSLNTCTAPFPSALAELRHFTTRLIIIIIVIIINTIIIIIIIIISWDRKGTIAEILVCVKYAEISSYGWSESFRIRSRTMYEGEVQECGWYMYGDGDFEADKGRMWEASKVVAVLTWRDLWDQDLFSDVKVLGTEVRCCSVVEGRPERAELQYSRWDMTRAWMIIRKQLTSDLHQSSEQE